MLYISQIDIKGFGKWVDQSFSVNPNLQVFYGQNEAGKSTLQSFIHSIFFGFAKKNEKRLRYEPLMTSEFGGRIHIEDSKYGQVIIERKPGPKVAGKGKLIRPGQDSLGEPYIKKVLYGIDLDLYRSLYSFDLDELAKIYQLKPEELEGQFLNLSVSGADDYLSLSKKLQGQAEKLYTPGGRVRPLNMALDDLDNLQKEVYLARDQNSQYTQMKNEVNSIDQAIIDLNEKINNLEKDYNQIVFLIDNFEKFERYNWLNYQLSLDTIQVSEDDQESFNNLFQEQKELSTQVDRLMLKMKALQQEANHSKHMSEYMVSQAFYNQQFNRLKTLNQKASHLKEINFKLAEKNASQNRLKGQLGLSLDHDLPKKIESQDIDQLKDWQNLESEKENRLDELDKKLHQVDYQERLSQQAKSQNQPKSSQPNIFIPIIIFVAVLALAISLGLSILGSLLTGGIASLVSLFFTVKLNQSQKTDEHDAVDQEEDFKGQRENIIKEQKRLYQEIDQIKQAYQAFLIGHCLPTDETIQELLSKQSFYNELLSNHQDIAELELQKNQYVEELDQDTADLQVLGELYPINETPIHRIDNLNQFKDIIDRESKENEEQSKNIHHLGKQLEENEELLDINDKRLNQLLNKYETSSTVQLSQWVKQSQDTEKHRQEAKSLKSYLKGSDYLGVENLNKNKVQNQKLELMKKIQDIKKDKDRLFEQKTSLAHQMKDLEQGRDYVKILQRYENQVTDVERLIEEFLVNQVASDLIELTIRQGIKDHWPIIINQARDYFNRLTHGSYVDIQLKEGNIHAVSRSQESFKVSQLSRGTAEPLYAAIRLAAIKIYTDKIKLPVLIDDGFVNLDPSRRSVIYDILEEISDHTQVIFFTFDRTVFDHFKEQNIISL